MMFRDRQSAVAARRSRSASTKRLLESLESRILMTAAYTGTIEVSNLNTISGYAYDPASPDTSIEVSTDSNAATASPNLALVIDAGTSNQEITPIAADIARPDVTFPTSFNKHGFSFDTTSELAGTHTVELVELSPASQTILSVLATSNFTNQAPTGVIQSSTATNVTGYDYDPDSPSTSLITLLVIDNHQPDQQTFTQTANITVPALASTIGSTDHGFSFTIPALSSGTHTIEIFGTDTTSSITSQIGSTITVGGVATTTNTLTFTTQPTTATAGATLAPVVVSLKDPSGNLLTSDASTVTLTIASGPTGAAIGGTATATVSNGIATFNNLSFSTPGSYILTATDATDALVGTSTAFTINQLAVVAPPPDPTSVKLLVKGQPKKATTTSSLTGPITVDVVTKKNKIVPTDESAVTLSILKGPAGGTISGTTTVAAINGVATFNNIILSGAGKYTLQATDAGLAIGKGKVITVAALPAASLVITTEPSNVAANAAMAAPIAIEALDRNGNLATATKGSVKLAIASGPAGAKLAGNSASIKNGVASFPKLKIKTAGTYVLTVSVAGLSATTSSFTVA